MIAPGPLPCCFSHSNSNSIDTVEIRTELSILFRILLTCMNWSNLTSSWDHYYIIIIVAAYPSFHFNLWIITNLVMIKVICKMADMHSEHCFRSSIHDIFYNFNYNPDRSYEYTRIRCAVLIKYNLTEKRSRFGILVILFRVMTAGIITIRMYQQWFWPLFSSLLFYYVTIYHSANWSNDTRLKKDII